MMAVLVKMPVTLLVVSTVTSSALRWRVDSTGLGTRHQLIGHFKHVSHLRQEGTLKCYSNLMETNKPPPLSIDQELRCLLDQIADQWTLLVIGLLEPGPKRFTALRRAMEGVSQKMLTQTLRGLERNGLVHRTVFPQIPPRVEYTLTPLGQTLCEPLAAIRHWTEAHREEIMAARRAYDESTQKEH